LAGQGAWLGKPEGLAAHSGVLIIKIHLLYVKRLSKLTWRASFFNGRKMAINHLFLYIKKSNAHQEIFGNLERQSKLQRRAIMYLKYGITYLAGILWICGLFLLRAKGHNDKAYAKQFFATAVCFSVMGLLVGCN
jgi:hypothetical protein